MLILFLVIILNALNTNKLMSETEKPVAKKVKHESINHGIKTNDPYYWMRERDSEDVLDYIEQENNYSKEKLSHTEGLQSELFEEITGRIKEEEESVLFFV
jgi:oligopeptidase B